MTDDEEFENVTYQEFEPTLEREFQLDTLAEGKPCILITAYSAKSGGLGLELELGGGLTTDLIVPMLEKALAAYKQGFQSKDS